MAVLTISNFDDTIYDALCQKAEKVNRSVSQQVADLIAWAFNEREDIYFSKVADEVHCSNTEWVGDSDEIWK